MASENSRDILASVEAALAGKELAQQPRAFLALRMCQFSMLFAPDETERYWKILLALKGKLPPELNEDLAALSSTIEETVAVKRKGFTAEMLEEVNAAIDLAATDAEEAKRQLLDCETRLKKRFKPFGKGPVWKALVEAWTPIDRAYALGLLKNLSGSLQQDYITKMNKASPLSTEEWSVLVSGIGIGKVERSALNLLEDEEHSLALPDKALRQVAQALRNSMAQLGGQGNEAGVTEKVKLYSRLLALHVNTEAAGEIPGLLDELYVFIAKTAPLDVIWMARFSYLIGVVGIGVMLKTLGMEVMTPAHMEQLIGKTPPYLVNFVWAQWSAVTAAGQVEATFDALMERTGQDELAEAWFLATLVEQGLGAEALALAKKSERAEALLPRLRRAWLCSHPETVGSAVTSAEMSGDPIGEFLVRGTADQRATYLRSVTQDGRRSVPGALWAGAGTEDEPEGLRGFWKSLSTSKKSADEIVNEYLKRNPLYSSYRRDTKTEDRFAEALRVNGYGDYRYQSIDGALLATFVVWGDQEPGQVRSVLQAMWEAIRPDDQILMVNWLRNAIMSRCVNVFAADAEVLTQDYLGWLKRELVDKGRQWQFGNQMITLKYPNTSPLQFCIAAAATVGGTSPARRDRILVAGLQKFDAEPKLVETAAQLYNSDKEPLVMEPPVKLKPNLVSSWHMGVVKNAIPMILRSLMASAA